MDVDGGQGGDAAEDVDNNDRCDNDDGPDGADCGNQWSRVLRTMHSFCVSGRYSVYRHRPNLDKLQMMFVRTCGIKKTPELLCSSYDDIG